MQLSFRKLAAGVDDFLFERTTVEALGVFRIALGLFVLHILLLSFPNWERFYGENATVPLWLLRERGDAGWSAFGYSGAALWIWGLYAAASAAAIGFTLGLFTRANNILVFLIYTSMVTRNTWMVNGQDQVAVLLLFLGIFAPLGGAYSFDNRRRGSSQTNTLHSVWGWRLMQMSVALIYLSCGPTKLQHWRFGDALYFTSFSYQWFRFPSVTFFHTASFSIVATYLTIIVESAFPILVWFPLFRRPMLVVMAGFHLAVMALLSPAVFHFNLVMLVALLLFLDNSLARKLMTKLLRHRK